MKALALSLLTLLSLPAFTTTHAAEITPAEARAIAKEAYIYGYPMVDSYRIQHAWFVDRSNPEFKAPWNEITNIPRVYTPADTTVQTPNTDTSYSILGLDLRTEPMVITVPEVEPGRYFSVQLIDLYTHNFCYLGVRANGNEGGSYMITGPSWKGASPGRVAKVIRSESWFVLAIFRTELRNPEDIENVKKIQASYKVQPLSKWPSQPSPPPAPAVQFVRPVEGDALKRSPEFFNVLNFVLQFCAPHPDEFEMIERLARIDVGSGKTFELSKFSPKVRKAIGEGMADAWKEYQDLQASKLDTGAVTPDQLFGSRATLKNNYLYRMAGAVRGIYGNSRDEALYPIYQTEDGAKGNYTLRFEPGQLPPVRAFWSVTMYEMPASLLVANPLNRYLINSSMLPGLKLDADGGLTIYVQHDSPGKEKESNWLPAPNGPFRLFMRLYWPKREALNGKWANPPLVKVN